MGLHGDSEVLYSSRVRSISSVPLLFVDSWVAPEHAGPISGDSLKQKSISEMLLANGVRFRYVTEEITAVAADPHIAAALHVEVGAPLLCVTRLVSEEVGKAVMYLTGYMTSERSRVLLSYEEDSEQILEGKLVHDISGQTGNDV
jgi:GntR family transcriptional regulator